MTDSMHGYDVIVAISQRAIQDQLAQLFMEGVLPRRLQIDFSDVGVDASIEAVLDMPEIWITGGGPTDLIFVQPLIEGVWTEHGTSMPFTNWALGYRVDLACYDLDLDELTQAAAAGEVPQGVLQGAQELAARIGEIGITALSPNFGGLSAQNIDPDSTRVTLTFPPGTPAKTISDSEQDVVSTLTAGFKAMASNGRRWTLAWPVIARDQRASFVPTARSFSTSGSEDRASLNVLFMTDGHALPAAGSEVFDAPLTQDPNGTERTAARLLMDQFLPLLTTEYGEFGMSCWSRNGQHWLFAEKVTKGQMKDGHIAISVTPQTNSSQVHISYTYTLTKKEHVLGIPSGTVTQTATWEAWFEFEAQGNQLLGAVRDVSQPVVSYDQDEDLWARLMDLFVPFTVISDAAGNVATLHGFPDVNAAGQWQVGPFELTLLLPSGTPWFLSTVFDDEDNLISQFPT